MERRDYLMRYFDQLGEVIARLMGFRKRKDWEHAHEYIDEVSNDFLGIDINELRETDTSDLVDFLLKELNFTLDRLNILAELLKEKGETYFQQLNSVDALIFLNHLLSKTGSVRGSCRRLFTLTVLTLPCEERASQN